MKKFFYLVAGLALAMTMITIDVDARSKKVKISQEQKMAQDPNRKTIRAWGMYEDFATMNLEAFAAMNARASLAEQTAVLVSRALELYADSKNVAGINERGREDSARALQQNAENQTKSVAKEIIQNSRVLQSTRYEVSKRSSLQVCYAVVEISIKDVLINIKNTKKIKEALDELESGLTGNPAAKLDLNSSEFEKSMEKSFEELKEGKLVISNMNL